MHRPAFFCTFRPALFLVPLISLVLLISTPLVASAENACPTLTRTLTIGARGDDVLQLQKYLINDGQLLSDYATGYFGTLTEIAVGNWQRAHKVVSSSDPGAGWGSVGPRTRAAIAQQCDPVSPSQSPSSSPATTGAAPSANPGQCRLVPRPTPLCASSWQAVRGDNGCVASWFCVAISSSVASSSVVPIVSSSTIVNPSNKPPVISSFTGPLSLDIGEVGRWSVKASDPEGGALTYTFAWGDSGSPAFDQVQRFSQSFSTTPSGARAYASAGSYQVSVTVHDPVGNATRTSLSVGVPRASAASASATTGSGGSCNSAAGMYQNGQTISGQLISGGSSTYSVASRFKCTNGAWVCVESCAAGQGVTTGTSGASQGGAPALGSGGAFWCFTASAGYWSSTPCANNVEHDPTKIGTGNPFGSSNANAQVGGICAPDGRQEFLACPAMQNCFGGGTYLLCKNSLWVRM